MNFVIFRFFFYFST
ncbi:pheST operon leader peptide PheM [Serratia quinivorans]|uniref:pheST attenuator peptide n=1 Tax=Serratia quinivorans TaxID=137545 RepID=A0ABV3UGA3_9GAMM|nr:pheST operon leader peptide PheM [Serratia quinivorans]